MVRKKLPKNDMEMYILPGSSLLQTTVTVTKTANNSVNLASHIEKEKKERKREVYTGKQKRKQEYKMQIKKNKVEPHLTNIPE